MKFKNDYARMLHTLTHLIRCQECMGEGCTQCLQSGVAKVISSCDFNIRYRREFENTDTIQKLNNLAGELEAQAKEE